MIKLLSANLLRLKKSILFWGLLLVSFGFGLFTVYTELRDRTNYGIAVQVDSILFFYAITIGLFSAVFVSLFFGTEYSDGTIRNKIIAGHSRWQIYLVNLLTGYAVTVLSTAATLLAVLAVGVPLIGGWTVPAEAFALNLLGSLGMEAAFCAIFTLIAMNCSKKSLAAVSSLLLFFALMMAMAYVDARLDAPEFIQGYELSVGGQVVESEPEANPKYLRGGERKLYEFAYDLLPTGQARQYTTMTVPRPARLAVCSAALTAGFTALGIALFRRKDLK